MLLNRIFARACFALFFAALETHGGQMELLPGNGVRIAVEATASQRIAVDVSSNLVNWTQITNVAPAAGQITFANDASQADPARFFRISDGDDTFAISGFVDGGQFFGGMANATVSENASGTSVKTDANGFFHFDQRFFRTNFPIVLTATLETSQVFQRVITATEAGTFLAIRTLEQPLLPFDLVDSTCHFKVTGGPRAGLEYTIRFYDDHFTMTGGITGDGGFRRSAPVFPVLYLTNSAAGTNAANDLFLWPAGSALGNYGWFSGIPGTNGVLAGNGIVTREQVSVAPTSLVGLAFSIGDGEVQFGGGNYNLKWEDTVTTNSYSASRDGNFWNATLINNGAWQSLSLYFVTATNGTFKLLTPSGLVVSGEMHQIPSTLSPPDGTVPAPASLSQVTLTTVVSGLGSGTQYTVTLSGGATGSFTATGPNGEWFGSGSYTYAPFGTQAHLNLTYTTFPGDYDDVILNFFSQAGSGGQNSFSGSQRISDSIFTFTGTFTY